MTVSLNDYTQSLSAGIDLDPDQIPSIANFLIGDDEDDETKCEFLKKLSEKGETNEEFSGFVGQFRKLAKNPHLDEFSGRAIDLCGTGGDRSGSFNISTFVSLLVAAAGVPVIKHGNRSISSKCGSADMLEALGIPMETDSAKLNSSLAELNFCFLFAPHFHPAFKSLVPVRKKLAEQGIITIFNRLGPCLNPATPAYQILGVYDPSYLDQIAYSLNKNGSNSGWVVHGKIDRGTSVRMDELTACGFNLVRPYGKDTNEKITLAPNHWGMKTYSASDLDGGSLSRNLSILKDLLNGSAPAGLKATILINASTALWLAGKAESLDEGIAQANELLADGSVSRWLNKAKDFYSK